MNRQTLLSKLEALDRRIGFPPSFNQRVLRTATDEELDELECEIEREHDELWRALVALYTSGERTS